MKKILYIDCQYGIAGDMLLSSLLDLGVDVDYLISELKKVTNFHFELGIKNNDQYGITAKHLELQLDEKIHPVHGHHHNHYSAIKQMIRESDLNEHVKKMSLDVFKTIAEAEGKIHNVPIDDVAFHEVGAVDSIIDIIGNCIAIDKLDVDEIICSPVSTGYGKVNIQHGLYPVPTPATLDMLRGVPLSGFEAKGELTTPTGAAIVKTLASQFKETISGKAISIGYGAGTKKFAHPNIVRTVLLAENEKKNSTVRNVASIICEVDDMTGEDLGELLSEMMDKGALDIYYTPIHMKKNRPAIQITVLCKLEDKDEFQEKLLQKTSTFGVRTSVMHREILDRKFDTLKTEYGDLKIKCGFLKGKLVKVTPEFESIRLLAKSNEIDFHTMYNLCIGKTTDYMKERVQ